LVFDGERLKENCDFTSVLNIKHLNEITDMNSSVTGDESGSPPFTEDTGPTSTVYKKDPGTLPASIHHDALQSVWPPHPFNICLSAEFVNN